MDSLLLLKAIKIINSGGIVAFPTETVYGIGANAFNDEACKKIYRLKGRPFNNPLIVHVSSLKDAEEFAIFDEDAYSLAKNFWPGPLTLVLPLRSQTKICATVLAGHSTIAIRVPAGAIAKHLINATGPIAAPSANPSGYISSTAYSHVKAYFPNLFILQDRDQIMFGLESTIVNFTSDRPTILRYGSILPDAMEELMNKKLKSYASDSEVLLAPGMLQKHYAPITKIRLNATSVDANREVALNFGNSILKGNKSLNLSLGGSLIEAAANLYSMLIKLDNYAEEKNMDSIAIAPIPNIEVGLAINDRLRRASSS